jgi:hypothetical protein
MRRILLLGLVLASLSCAARTDSPRTNTCSDPLGLYTATAYQPCCIAHDQAYAIGGSEQDRLVADRALYLCVRTTQPDDAASMFVAVRLFGRSRFHYKEHP